MQTGQRLGLWNPPFFMYAEELEGNCWDTLRCPADRVLNAIQRKECDGKLVSHRRPQNLGPRVSSGTSSTLSITEARTLCPPLWDPGFDPVSSH